MIDVLNKHFQNSLHVSKAQSALVQGFWYGGYFLLALPAGLFARRAVTRDITYTVDAETKRVLDELAARWAVSRSEALRRAIRQAAGAAGVGDRLAALDALQQQAAMTGGRARPVVFERKRHVPRAAGPRIGPRIA